MNLANAYYADHQALNSKTMMKNAIKNVPKPTVLNTKEISPRPAGNTYFQMSKNNSFTDIDQPVAASPLMKMSKP